MDFALSDEQIQLRSVARDFFAQHCGTFAARDYLDGGLDAMPDAGQALGSMGFLGLLADEALGGAGGTVVDLTVVAEQAGHHLAPTALITTAAQAIPLLASAAGHGSTAAGELLEPVIAGKQVVAILPPERLRRDGDFVSGRTPPVLQGAVADAALTLLDDGLVLLPLSGDGVRRSFTAALDPTRELAALHLDGCPARIVLDAAETAGRVWRRALSLGMLTLAAECGGVVDAALEMGVNYAKQRHAFGRPIGSFQAVKHALVETYLLAEQLRSLVWLAAARADAGTDFGCHAAGALAFGADAAQNATDVLIQVHGGIGVTWEHDAHLFWRRARTDRHLFGDPAELRHDIAVNLIAEATASQGISA